MNFNHLYTYFFLLCVFALNGNAQEPLVVTFDKDDYNASSKNWSVAVNSKGLVYIGNHDGLLESDGQTWKLYKLPVGRIIRSVAIDDYDRIYTGSFEEFGFWEADVTGELHYTSLSDSLVDFTFHNEQIWKIIIREEKVYFQAFNNIFIYDGSTVYPIKNCPNIIFLLEAGKKLIAHDVSSGLVELKKDSFELIPNSEILSGAEIKVVLPFDNNNFLLGSGTQGLYLWKNNDFEIWECEAQEILKDKQINHGLHRNNKFYIGTITDGVYIINKEGKILQHLNTSSSLANNTILGMCFDDNGNLWLNHDKGLSFVDFNAPYIPVISKNNQLGAIHAAAFHKNKLYIGTNQGLYFVPVEDSVFSTVELDDFALVQGSQGQIWDLQVFDGQLICGHNNGTFRVEDEQLVVISNLSGGYCIRKLTEDLLIQSTYTNLVLYEKNETGNWVFKRQLNNFTEPVRYVETDFRGNIWASHNRKGIYKLELNEDRSEIVSSEYYGKENGFALESKTHVFKIDNRIVFTSGDGIYTYDDLGDSLLVYSELNNQLGRFNAAEKIIQGHGNSYWFITSNNAGLFEINKNEVQLKMEMNLSRPGYHLVEESPNIVSAPNNQYLICLEDGFTIFKNNLSEYSKKSNPLLIRAVENKASGKKLPLIVAEENIPEIAFRNNAVSFAFSPVRFPGNGNRFSVKLEGLNENWSSFSENSSVTYSRLPWGEYKFRVKGIDEFGKLIPEASYKFEIIPPWYASNYAIAGYGLLILLFFLVLPISTKRYFRKQQEAYKLKQEKIFREKQKEQELLAEQKIVKLRNQQLQNELENKSKEIANNTMVIIRRNETLTDIKKELEKQKEILGSRFPNKNYEKVIRLINRNLTNEEEWKVFEENFDQAHNNFFKRLKEQYPLLTPGDLRLCAYLRLNLASKEIAPLMNISTRGVEIHRYRLRKRLHLSTDENLVEFILRF